MVVTLPSSVTGPVPVTVRFASACEAPTAEPKVTAPVPALTVRPCTPAVAASTVLAKATAWFAVARMSVAPSVTAPP